MKNKLKKNEEDLCALGHGNFMYYMKLYVFLWVNDAGLRVRWMMNIKLKVIESNDGHLCEFLL